MKDEIDISECTAYDEIKQVISDWINYYTNGFLQNLHRQNIINTGLPVYIHCWFQRRTEKLSHNTWPNYLGQVNIKSNYLDG